MFAEQNDSVSECCVPNNFLVLLHNNAVLLAARTLSLGHCNILQSAADISGPVDATNSPISYSSDPGAGPRAH